MRPKARWNFETNAKGIERQSVVSEVLLCLLCKWCNENLNVVIWYFAKLIICSLLCARNSHIWKWNSNFNAVSFVHAHLSQSFIFKFIATEVYFCLSCIRYASDLLAFTTASEDLKGYSEFCLNVEQDRHFRWTSFQKPWDWKLSWQDVNVLSNGLIQAKLGSVSHHF